MKRQPLYKSKPRPKEYKELAKQFVIERKNKGLPKDSTFQREYDLIRSFGITMADYVALQHKQNNLCAICKLPETIVDRRSGKPRNLAVDHCHTTLKVRGLLCMGCNQGIGNFKDNLSRLENAINYLKET